MSSRRIFPGEDGVPVRINDGIDLAAPHRQADAPRRAQHPARRPVRLVRVGRDHELPPEVVAQQPDVVDALVRLPVLPDVKADMGQDGLVARMIDVVQALLVVPRQTGNPKKTKGIKRQQKMTLQLNAHARRYKQTGQKSSWIGVLMDLPNDRLENSDILKLTRMTKINPDPFICVC